MFKLLCFPILFITSILMQSCESPIRNINTISNNKTFKIEIDSLEKFKSYSKFSKAEFCILSIPDDKIGSIKRIQFFDNKVIVLDNLFNQLFLTNSDFKFIKKLSTPENTDFTLEATNFVYDKSLNQIIVLDNKNHKLIYFSLKGELLKIKDSPIFVTSFAKFGDDFYFYKYLPSSIYDNYKIERTDSFLKTKDRMLPYNFNNGVDFDFIGSTESFDEVSCILITIPFSDTIYEISKKGISSRYSISLKKPYYSNNSIKDTNDIQRYLNSSHIGNSLYENENYLIFNYFESGNEEICIFNKKNNKINWVKKKGEFTDYIFKFLTFHNSEFYFTLSFSKLLNDFKNNQKFREYLNVSYPEVYNTLSNFKEESNLFPIIKMKI